MGDWPKPVSDVVNKKLADYSRDHLGGTVADAYRDVLTGKTPSQEDDMSEPPTNILRAARFADIEHRLLELGIMPSHLVEYVRLAEYQRLPGDDAPETSLRRQRMRVADAIMQGEIDECLPMMLKFLEINRLYPDDGKA